MIEYFLNIWIPRLNRSIALSVVQVLRVQKTTFQPLTVEISHEYPPLLACHQDSTELPSSLSQGGQPVPLKGYGRLAQLVEQETFNLLARGSSPRPSTSQQAHDRPSKSSKRAGQLKGHPHRPAAVRRETTQQGY